MTDTPRTAATYCGVPHAGRCNIVCTPLWDAVGDTDTPRTAAERLREIEQQAMDAQHGSEDEQRQALARIAEAADSQAVRLLRRFTDLFGVEQGSDTDISRDLDWLELDSEVRAILAALKEQT